MHHFLYARWFWGNKEIFPKLVFIQRNLPGNLETFVIRNDKKKKEMYLVVHILTFQFLVMLWRLQVWSTYILFVINIWSFQAINRGLVWLFKKLHTYSTDCAKLIFNVFANMYLDILLLLILWLQGWSVY